MRTEISQYCLQLKVMSTPPLSPEVTEDNINPEKDSNKTTGLGAVKCEQDKILKNKSDSDAKTIIYKWNIEDLEKKQCTCVKW